MSIAKTHVGITTKSQDLVSTQLHNLEWYYPGMERVHGRTMDASLYLERSEGTLRYRDARRGDERERELHGLRSASLVGLEHGVVLPEAR